MQLLAIHAATYLTAAINHMARECADASQYILFIAAVHSYRIKID